MDFQGFGNFLKGLVGKFLPQQQAPQQVSPSGKVYGDPSQMKLTVGFKPQQAMAAENNPPQQFGSTLAQSAGIPAPTSQPPTNGFKYQMGLSDYSQFRPQVQQALQGSPLAQYADNFIQAGNTHHVDPRVLLTVANNESSLGQNYPQDSYNPFGYNARAAGMIQGKDGKMYVNVDAGLKSAGFTSLPMAIDRLTQRFSDHPVNATGQAYANFRQNPTIENLQAAYNASDAEKENYIKNARAFTQRFK